MAALVRLIEQIATQPIYRQQVLAEAPATAQHDPGHGSLMMGYDFHLGETGTPRLIEINTNAGGGLCALQAQKQATGSATLRRSKERFIASFAAEIRTFDESPFPMRIAIIDETPQEQFLYPEMAYYAELLRQQGAEVVIASPQELNASTEGVFYRGKAIDLIYNRHCDFYLETPELAGIRAAYEKGRVCLSPHPFAYTLFADKRRLPLLRSDDLHNQLALNAQERQLLHDLIPESALLSSFSRDRLWSEKSQWIFKPVDRFGSRGVLAGRKITRGRFGALDPETTLVQRLVPPSLTIAEDGSSFKTDYRLFTYRRKLIGLTARLYQGQVTNLRTAGGGFAAVSIGN